jgi:predicted O-methyltransferase YrrM
MPIQARHAELSVIASMDDALGKPDAEQMRLGLEAATSALEIDLTPLHSRSEEAGRWLSIFPGEHYQLLAALVRRLAPQCVVEIGTFTGLSALAMMTTLPPSSRLATFDVVRWDALAETALTPQDFRPDGRLVQILADLSVRASFEEHAHLLLSASLIFVDGPKDGRFEPDFFGLLTGLCREQRCLVVFDDIRLWNMLAFWRSIDVPKLDLTSFGHWSGTGLCWLEP